ncbi:MAG: DUF2807 domain-containing protein [Saprospiraceae bacterium]|nr:DUF2807 domain-containing protein [Saprospiraceae bacterium]
MRHYFNLKFYVPIIFIGLLGHFTTGCFIDDAFDCERGNGNDITETFSVRDFTGVRLTMDANVFITQGEVQDVTITAQANIIDELQLRVRNDVLIIDTDRCIRDFNEVDIFITIPEIRELSLSGSGKIIGENTFLVEDIELNLTGSGDIDLGLEAEYIRGAISGSGEVTLEGKGRSLDYRISGSGDLSAFDLFVRQADLTISGSGDMEVFVEEFLDVRISGSGDVMYKGNPEIDSRVSGSGNVIDAN